MSDQQPKQPKIGAGQAAPREDAPKKKSLFTLLAVVLVGAAVLKRGK